MLSLAASLGSDVPYFLYGGMCFVQGTGNMIQPLAQKFPFTILLVLPNIHVSTAWAYNELSTLLFTGINKDATYEATSVETILNAVENPESFPHVLKNDFEVPVFTKYPELQKVKEELYSRGALYAQMSGSGSTMYGVFATAEQAAFAAQSMQPLQTYICSSTNRKFITE